VRSKSILRVLRTCASQRCAPDADHENHARFLRNVPGSPRSASPVAPVAGATLRVRDRKDQNSISADRAGHESCSNSSPRQVRTAPPRSWNGGASATSHERPRCGTACHKLAAIKRPPRSHDSCGGLGPARTVATPKAALPARDKRAPCGAEGATRISTSVGDVRRWKHKRRLAAPSGGDEGARTLDL
jgi:hypothetical protein